MLKFLSQQDLHADNFTALFSPSVWEAHCFMMLSGMSAGVVAAEHEVTQEPTSFESVTQHMLQKSIVHVSRLAPF